MSYTIRKKLPSVDEIIQEFPLSVQDNQQIAQDRKEVKAILKEGNQVVNTKSNTALDLSGLSITDPCLGWEETEEFLLKLACVS